MGSLVRTRNHNNLMRISLSELKTLFARIFKRYRNQSNLSGKIVLIDNDELLLVWEYGLRDKRITMEENTWRKFEQKYGKGSPEVTAAFVKWQESLYTYIEKEKDRFLKQRKGSQEGLWQLLQSGAKTIVVTKGAKPYTEKCFNLVGLSTAISDIYAPAPGNRTKRFVDAVLDHGKDTSYKCLRDTIIVGHDTDKDMAWDLVPARNVINDGKAPVMILFEALSFDREVNDPLDALPEIVELLAQKGDNNIWRGFQAIVDPADAVTKNYTFKVGLYCHPKKTNKAKIPVVYDIKPKNGH